MPIYNVIRKSDNEKIYTYSADSVIEWNGMELTTHYHTEVVEVVEEEIFIPEKWYINVGAFYDRFGAYKIPILASSNPIVQAIIKDTTVRKYIDLKGRRQELVQAMYLLQSEGFAVDIQSVLDVEPNNVEVYSGN